MQVGTYIEKMFKSEMSGNVIGMAYDKIRALSYTHPFDFLAVIVLKHISFLLISCYIILQYLGYVYAITLCYSIPLKIHLRFLRSISTPETKHGIGLDGNKIEPTHGLSVPIFCSIKS